MQTHRPPHIILYSCQTTIPSIQLPSNTFMASSNFPSSRDASHLSQQLRSASSSSSTKHRRVLSSSSKAVRCKLLHKLGITPKSTTHQHSPTRLPSSSREYLRNVPRYEQPLKYTHDHRCRRLSLEDREEEREPTTSSRRSSTTQYRSSTSISSSPQRVILSDNDIEQLRNEISNLFLDDERQSAPPTHRRQSSPKCVSSFPVMMEEGDRKKKRRSVGFQETVTVVP